MSEFKSSSVRMVTVGEGEDGQRLDNFLMNLLKGVPRTRVYRLIRKGEVRVNKKRAEASDRLTKGDQIRVPPFYTDQVKKPAHIPDAFLKLLKDRILYENEAYLVLNKPSGYAVHGGSTIKMGIVEAMQKLYSDCPQLELVHRLDRETSGCLIFAKKKKILREFHELLRTGGIKKTYHTLLKGKFRGKERDVMLPLKKSEVPHAEKRLVRVCSEGKEAHTTFRVVKTFQYSTLMEAELHTGRTHQIRVHASHIGHPVAMDDRYGDSEFNRSMKELGLKRLFLHAHSIEFILPDKREKMHITAPLDHDLQLIVEKLSRYAASTT